MILTRPLVVLDLETTSTDTETARIVQIGLVRMLPDGDDQSPGEPQTLTKLINPGVPIPPEASAVHGITDEMVKNAPRFVGVTAELIAKWIEDADLAGYNVDAYDLPVLEREFQRSGFAGVPGPEGRVILDAFAIEKKHRPRTLENVYRELTGEDLSGSHDALSDALATAEILRAQMIAYGLQDRGETLQDVEAALMAPYLDRRCRFLEDEDGCLCVAFGKYASRESPRRVADLPPGYVQYMLDNFDPPAVAILKRYRAGAWRSGSDPVAVEQETTTFHDPAQGGLF